MNLENLTLEELVELKSKIDDEIARRDTKVTVTITANPFKGSGKAWIAEIDPNTKKKIQFLNPVHVEKDGYVLHKTYELLPGKYYEINEKLSRSYDRREVVRVDAGGNIQTINKREVRV